ncbi:phosphatidylinositol-binding clathrin assembly protein-like, partial [Neolamprologus brichardi]|uniref:phosphatidylinositol-binding clathrin assembly protein-like n=1 Tax=Neolamprologus brichardi TaxID=32507 RepID=UPI0016439218
MNVNIPQLADTLFERTASTSWVVVFKSLTTTHHLMVYGNERPDGVMRTMNTEKLLKTVSVIQTQMDVLLDFNDNSFKQLHSGRSEKVSAVRRNLELQVEEDELQRERRRQNETKRLVWAVKHWTAEDCKKTEKYFDMKKVQCKEGLDLYKKFLTRMTRISEFLKVAEQVGIDRGDIPDLSQAPSSLLEALEQHLASLEGKKVKDSTAASRASTLSSAVSSLANTGMSFSKVDEREKQAALEEEQARLKALK